MTTILLNCVFLAMTDTVEEAEWVAFLILSSHIICIHPANLFSWSDIWGYISGDFLYSRYDTVYFHKWVPTLWRNIMPSSSLKMEAVCILKILLPTYQITLCCNLKGQNLVHSIVFPTKMQPKVTKTNQLEPSMKKY
jgi:hypothetical protein